MESLNQPKQILKIGIVGNWAHNGILYHVISEPGDMTRYDYIAHASHSMFNFMPRGSTFEFPHRIDYWDVKDITDEQLCERDSDLIKLSERLKCNPNTVMECIRTIKELYKPGGIT